MRIVIFPVLVLCFKKEKGEKYDEIIGVKKGISFFFPARLARKAKKKSLENQVLNKNRK